MSTIRLLPVATPPVIWLALFISLSPTSVLPVPILAYISIYLTLLLGIRSTPKIYSIPAAFGILATYTLNTGPTLVVYIQPSYIIPIIYGI